MPRLDVIRAWKDEQYRLSLSEAERALLPEHPAGVIELTDGALDDAVGGTYVGSNYCTHLATCGTMRCYCQE
jgi:mersacidin/lichenicidin family type 2 lantibiotic